MQNRRQLFPGARSLVLRACASTLCYFYVTCTAGQNPLLLAAQDWTPEKTWVFAVGVLEWKHLDSWPPMPSAKLNRRDVQLVEHFRSAGIPAQQIVYLQDKQATRQAIQQMFVALLSQTKPGDLLLFYYAGHGSRDRHRRQVHFANYDAQGTSSAWPMPAIFDTIEQHFHGDRCVLMADCCYSGGLADEAMRRKSHHAYAFLCSSFSHNSSTGQWTFTEALLKGFRGHPAVDINVDGEIEFEEIGHYAELDMGFFEEQKSVYGRTPSFPKRMKLAGARGMRTKKLGERVEVEWKGKWYRAQVIDARPGVWKIHYVNFDNSWDEWVGANRMRPFEPAQYPAGANVKIHWPEDGKWYPGTVVRPWYGLYLVHFTGYETEWDEWVDPKKVRQ